jgi:methyltransferase (TIGR00027 family)
MRIEGVGMTAKMTAAARALESRRPDRLFDDPLAGVLAGDDGVRWMEELRLPNTPVENWTIGPRTRFWDDFVLAAGEEGVRQFVMVAAGMDTRAFRLPIPPNATVFELDEAPVLAEKLAVLDREHATPRCRRVAVPVDLATDTWPEELSSRGFDRASPAVFVAEGLSMYIDGGENARLLDHLATLAAPENRLGIDMVSHDYLENPGVAPYFELARSRGVCWRFGSDDPEAFLAAHGWNAVATDIFVVGRRFGRWPPPGVSEDVARRAERASKAYFVTAERGA